MTSFTNENKYAVLMETNGEECESWYYFLKYNGNEKNLIHLSNQLDQIEMYVLEDKSTFDLDLEHLVSEQTAKEMTKLELNSISFHRKFDGKLKTVNLGLKRKDSNEKRINRIDNKLGFGKIENYIDEEDIDEEDLLSDRSESDHEEDEDLVPLPLNDENSKSENESDVSDEIEIINNGMSQIQVKKKKKKKKKNR